jgi:5-methyltetrahydropteroyltriglutamate--homocysteine methyltransferase
MLVDAEHRERIGVTDMDQEIELCVRMVNDVVVAAQGVSTSMHLCHGHFGRQRYSDGGYEPIMDALADIQIDRLTMEFVAPQSHGVGVLERFPENKLLGLGVIDHYSTDGENTETVVARVESAMQFVSPERITLNPDCGFSAGSQNPMDFDEAYLKLTSMCEAARVLRDRHRL